MNRLILMASVLGLLTACTRPSVPRIQRSARAISPPLATDLNPDPDILHVRLTAAPLPSGEPYLYAYEGQNPGPTLRAKLGDTLQVELVNQLDSPTTIHWHGLHVPFEMDGVAWMRDPVAPGETFTYTFPLNQVGTFWYHPHFNTDRQVEGGLYGFVIVEQPTEPQADEELLLIIDAETEPAEGHSAFGHGKITTKWRVNGQVRPTYTATGGQIVRARLLNASNAGFVALRGGELRVIAHDQGLLAGLQTPSLLLLAPGDRAELEWRIGSEGFTLEALPYSLNGGLAYGDAVPIMDVQVSAPAPAPAGLPWGFSGARPTPDPGHTDVLYAFAGSDRTQRWLINGERFPNVSIQTLRQGQDAVIEVRNLSSSEHPFHVHGMSFEVLSINGVAPALKQVEDTINLKIRDVVRLYVQPGEIGDWMAHCHILPHAEDGMMTVLRVSP